MKIAFLKNAFRKRENLWSASFHLPSLVFKLDARDQFYLKLKEYATPKRKTSSGEGRGGNDLTLVAISLLENFRPSWPIHKK